MTQPAAQAPGRRRAALRIALATLALACAAWGALALWYQGPSPPALRAALPALWLALTAAAVRGLWTGRRAAPLLWAAAFAVLLGWWSTLAPSHDRVWADDVARLLRAEIDGDRVVLHEVRDFEWRTPDDYDVRWETRSYDLRRLRSADLVLSYWMGPAIAHTLVSFGFDDGQRLVFSLEIRKERHERFSAIGGFFRQFEQVLIAADERDIVRTRSNARGEDVYLYRLNVPPQDLRALFLGYLDEAERIRREPAFYNTATSNCTTIVFELARRLAPGLPLDPRLLLSGYFDGYVHDQGGLTPGVDLATLRARGHINARARAASRDDYSRAIRVGVPGVPPEETAP
ncbi:DUF4105 domain-containing protein [Luteimonas huabeiensis]|uniref:Lnb N-terminal periplasmic domain-containing protein n=1 Tax=Luteimonas huabeiensis TaxID=1244513 RepID=UPI0004B94E90|nr:DUF4105 domain-containing protein [Luteimonas huabeiensis]